MYTQLVNNLGELGFTDVEPYLSEYLTTATKDGISLQEALYEISKREISLRNQRAAQIQVSVSHFPYIKTIDEFDFHFQNTVSRTEIKDLATLRFIENKENILFYGTPGTGKTHLATAIGIEAARKRNITYFITCHDLIQTLRKAHDENRLESRLKHFSKYKLLIIDEIGYLESTCPEYQNALSELMACKHLLMVVRKQKLPFLDSLLAQQDVFVLDLDQPYGNAGCILMASGQGRRFGENKLLTDLAGKPLIQWALDASAGLFAHRLVVTVHKEIEQLCLSQDIPVLLHPFPDRNDMIRLGMGEISSFIDRCAFLPSDQPMILPETIASLLLCAKNLPDFIWRPCSSDTVGSPVIFPSCFFEELKKLPPKKGGNVIVSRYPNLVRTLPVSYSEELKDIDTKEELLAVSQYLEQQSSNRRWRFDDCGAFAP